MNDVENESLVIELFNLLQRLWNVNKMDLIKNTLMDLFSSWDCSKLGAIKEDISSKTVDGEIFPPYIPFIGKDYAESRTLFYGTANNFSPERHSDICDKWSALIENQREKLTARLFYTPSFDRQYPDEAFEVPDFIGSYGVAWGVLGIFLYARFGEKIYDKRRILDKFALSNFFKFSLRRNGKDLNPNKLRKTIPQEMKYLECNFDLVAKEIETLRPQTIIVYKGDKQARYLQSRFGNKVEIIAINDPAWIWLGANGYLEKNGKWAKEVSNVNDPEAIALVDNYSEWCEKNSEGIKNKLKIYLLHYFKQFYPAEGK